MNISVAGLCGPICVDPEDGARLYEETASALARGNRCAWTLPALAHLPARS